MGNQSEHYWNNEEENSSDDSLLFPSGLLSLSQHTQNLSLRAKLAVGIQAKRIEIVHVQPALFDAWLEEHEK